MLSEGELAALKARPDNAVDVWAAKWVALRKQGDHFIGPCPIHSPDPAARDSTAFECWDDGWVCAVCQDGGDVIALIQRREHCDFRAAVARLDGAALQVSDDEQRRAREAQARRRAAREQESNQYRDKERFRARQLLSYGRPIAGTPVEAYLRQARGLDFPPDVRLRFDPAARYYAPSLPSPASGGGSGKGVRLVHTGPAMLAVIQRAGHSADPSRTTLGSGAGAPPEFFGAHTTWIDLDRPKGKAAIVDPAGGEALSNKKMRGSKQGGHIVVCGVAAPRVLVLGEGIEKVLAVWTALTRCGRDLAGWAFWSAADLGNLGGKALATVAHPTLTTPTGRPRRVPGPVPDPAAPAIVIPDSVETLILLGDSTSDRFATECSLRRAQARYAQRGDGTARAVVVAWAPPGMDFDELRPGDG